MQRLNLLCLPYAGAGAGVYRAWTQGLPGWLNVVPLHLPGREEQIGQRAIHEWPALIELLLREVLPYLTQPFAIFGHSMGALAGFELAHEIRRRHQLEPELFVASGCVAPARREPDLRWLQSTDDTLLAEVRRLKGTPQALLDSPEFMQMILPSLRADFHLCGSFRHQDRRPLASPLLMLVGGEDRIAERMEDIAAWSEEFTGAARLQRFPGDHFFINEHRRAVVELIVESLQAQRSAASAAAA